MIRLTRVFAVILLFLLAAGDSHGARASSSTLLHLEPEQGPASSSELDVLRDDRQFLLEALRALQTELATEIADASRTGRPAVSQPIEARIEKVRQSCRRRARLELEIARKTLDRSRDVLRERLRIARELADPEAGDDPQLVREIDALTPPPGSPMDVGSSPPPDFTPPHSPRRVPPSPPPDFTPPHSPRRVPPSPPPDFTPPHSPRRVPPSPPPDWAPTFPPQNGSQASPFPSMDGIDRRENP